MVTPAELAARGAFFVAVDADWGVYAVITSAMQNTREWRERVYRALDAGWVPPRDRVLDRGVGRAAA